MEWLVWRWLFLGLLVWLVSVWLILCSLGYSRLSSGKGSLFDYLIIGLCINRLYSIFISLYLWKIILYLYLLPPVLITLHSYFIIWVWLHLYYLVIMDVLSLQYSQHSATSESGQLITILILVKLVSLFIIHSDTQGVFEEYW